MRVESTLRIASAFLLFCASTALLGCMGLLGREERAPSSLGGYPVGVTSLTVADPTRDRELAVEVWYPAARASSDDPVVYRVKAAGTTFARLRSVAHAHRNVEAAREAGPCPVVVLSHGAGSSRFANASLAEVLASHGYVVAAPDHAGHTVDDKIFGISDEERAQSALDRPIDLTLVLDELAARSGRASSHIYAMVDMQRVAVAGHSFGAAAALGLVGARFDVPRQDRECRVDHEDRRCAAVPLFGPRPYRYRDERVKAALLITPAGYDLYRADGIARVDAPTLVIGARNDRTTPFEEYPRPIYRALKIPRYLLDLEEAGHLTATDVCAIVDSGGLLAKTFGGPQAVDGCGEGNLSPHDALDLVAMASLPFLDLYLNGNARAEGQLEAALARGATRSRVASNRRAGPL
jgi:predicted dienelactone hydrolase